MNINAKRVAAACGALIAGSLLLVPALPSDAGILPDPETVPCEAFGSGPDCVARRAQRDLERRCGVTQDPVSADVASPASSANDSGLGAKAELVLPVDVIAHTNRL